MNLSYATSPDGTRIAYDLSGSGPALIADGVQMAQYWRARCLWLETQNVNYAAIQFYQQLGFQWCGLDTTLYDSQESAAGEIALFFARPLR
jgi:ribosomal protein S18 acetylase RimI-like enzyme